MTIPDICEQLEDFDKDGVIFAEQVSGDFTSHSRAEVIPQNSDELLKRELSYCLEISIARDAVKVWSRGRDGQQPSTAQRAEAVCRRQCFNSTPKRFSLKRRAKWRNLPAPGPMECGLTNPARAGRQQR